MLKFFSALNYINPLSIFYLLLHPPLAYTRERSSFNTTVLSTGIIGIPMILALNIYLFSGGDNAIVEILIFITITSALTIFGKIIGLTGIYLTKDSLAYCVFFVKLYEIRKEDLFAVELKKYRNTFVLSAYSFDRNIGGLILEKISSYPYSGPYFVVSEDFIRKLPQVFDRSQLSEHIMNYPKKPYDKEVYSRLKQLDNLQSKVTESLGIRPGVLLLLLHPLSLIFIVRILSSSFLTSMIILFVVSPILTQLRERLIQTQLVRRKYIDDTIQELSHLPLKIKISRLIEYIEKK